MNDLHCRRLFVMSLSFLNVSPIDSTCMSLFILSTHRRLEFVSLSFRILYEVHRVEFGELSFYIFYLCRPEINASVVQGSVVGPHFLCRSGLGSTHPLFLEYANEICRRLL